MLPAAAHPHQGLSLCILENDDLEPPILQRHTRVAAMFERLFAQAGFRGRIDSFSARHGEYPDNFADCDAVLLTGSRADAFSDEAWVVALRERVHQLLALPAGATLLATHAQCPVAAFALEERVFCTQPHPEFTPDMSAFLLNKRRPLLGESFYPTAMLGLDAPHDGVALARFMVHFVQYGLSVDPQSGASEMTENKPIPI